MGDRRHGEKRDGGRDEPHEADHVAALLFGACMWPARIGVPPERALRTRGSEGLPACQLCLLSLPPPQLAIDFLIAPATGAGIGVGQSYCFKQLVPVHQVTSPFISPGPVR